MEQTEFNIAKEIQEIKEQFQALETESKELQQKLNKNQEERLMLMGAHNRLVEISQRYAALETNSNPVEERTKE